MPAYSSCNGADASWPVEATDRMAMFEVTPRDNLEAVLTFPPEPKTP
jgi:hypothetical protein